MNKKLYSVAALGLSIVVLNGCDQARQALGQTKQSPDEFAVFSRAPLSLPPDFGLRPPRPGAERPQQVNPRDTVRKALASSARRPATVAKAQTPAGLSPGEEAILRQTGAVNANPNIRQIVNQETTLIAAESKDFTDKIVFWRKPEAPGTTVDPDREARRIREKQALGEPINQGTIPTIQRKKKALLEGVFN